MLAKRGILSILVMLHGVGTLAAVHPFTTAVDLTSGLSITATPVPATLPGGFGLAGQEAQLIGPDGSRRDLSIVSWTPAAVTVSMPAVPAAGTYTLRLRPAGSLDEFQAPVIIATTDSAPPPVTPPPAVPEPEPAASGTTPEPAVSDAPSAAATPVPPPTTSTSPTAVPAAATTVPPPASAPAPPPVVVPKLYGFTAHQDLEETARLSIEARPNPGTPPHGFGEAAGRVQLISGDNVGHGMTIDEWNAARVVVSLPDIPLAGRYSLVIEPESATERFEAPVVIVNTDSATVPVAARISDARLGGSVAIDALPPGRIFRERDHAPIVLRDADGTAEPLVDVSGWGTQALTARLPHAAGIAAGPHPVTFGASNVTAVVTVLPAVATAPQTVAVMPRTVMQGQEVILTAIPSWTRFEEATHGPVRLESSGEAIPLSVVKGWGTGELTVRVPETTAPTGVYHLLLGDTPVATAAFIAPPDAITGLTVSSGSSGGRITIEALPRTARFRRERLGLPLLVAGGRRIPLLGVDGWGTGQLTATIPADAGVPAGRHGVTFERSTGDFLAAIDVVDAAARNALRATYRLDVVTVDVHEQTYDDPEQWDGKGDEIFFTGVVAQVDPRNLSVAPVVTPLACSFVYGDTNQRGSGRRAMGSASPYGGITSKDKNLPIHAALWQGELDQLTAAVVLYPMLFEFDGRGHHTMIRTDCPAGDDFVGHQSFLSRELLNAFRLQSLSLVQAAQLPSVTLLGNPHPLNDEKLIQSSVYLPATRAVRVESSPVAIIRPHVEGHRPIGAQLFPGDHARDSGRTVFVPQPIVLNLSIAELLIARGGEIAVDYTDHAKYVNPAGWLDGNYTVRYRVSRYSEPSPSNAVPPLPLPLETDLGRPLVTAAERLPEQ